MSKVKSLKSAYEAAVSLLRIDDAIQCVPGESTQLKVSGDRVAEIFLTEQKGDPDGHGH